ncbi:hypothetical protein TCAL_13245 [Tigriopus californicus]|uniref:Uncharacterized protein n=1 Tax=Tigriopus californicus TaxID=6832 RepID=A0A553PSH1_TIGCA|nr:hypothetical protein TCAL_13245 [Tigriopus californicus]
MLLTIPKPKTRNLTMNLLSEKVKCKSSTIQLNIAGVNSSDTHESPPLEKKFNRLNLKENFDMGWYENLKTLEEAVTKAKQVSGYEQDGLEQPLRRAQTECFSAELELLGKEQNLKKSSRLVGLSPMIDTNQLIRVGGRIDRAQAPYNIRHPVVLDPTHPVTHLILDNIHQEGNHGGTNRILSL